MMNYVFCTLKAGTYFFAIMHWCAKGDFSLQSLNADGLNEVT